MSGAEAVARERRTRLCDDVLRAAVAQMITVRMRNYGDLHGLPGIDVEIPGGAIKTATRDGDESFWIRCHS